MLMHNPWQREGLQCFSTKSPACLLWSLDSSFYLIPEGHPHKN